MDEQIEELKHALTDLLDAIEARFTPDGAERYPGDAFLVRDLLNAVANAYGTLTPA